MYPDASLRYVTDANSRKVADKGYVNSYTNNPSEYVSQSVAYYDADSGAPITFCGGEGDVCYLDKTSVWGIKNVRAEHKVWVTSLRGEVNMSPATLIREEPTVITVFSLQTLGIKMVN